MPSSTPHLTSLIKLTCALEHTSFQEHLPGTDVLTMVESAPAAFFQGTRTQVTQQVGAAAALLRKGLRGAQLERMYEEVPTLLMEPLESLQVGGLDVWVGSVRV